MKIIVTRRNEVFFRVNVVNRLEISQQIDFCGARLLYLLFFLLHLGIHWYFIIIKLLSSPRHYFQFLSAIIAV